MPSIAARTLLSIKICPSFRMAAEMRAAVAELTAKWRNYGFELGFGIGIGLCPERNRP